ncbi:MAG TPA: hypothetical protein VFU69_14640 [Ktedonobacterales bacterium]|nr:hypothetical protein [Ktedonobacterales bacterium]
MLLPEKHIWDDRHLVSALSLLCLALVALAGCHANNAAGNGSASARAVPAAPAGFSTFKSGDFSLSYPNGWTQQKPENGVGVQYMGPNNQVFVAASLGAIQITPAALDKAFCSLAGFGGTPSGAARNVKISGVNWVREQCGDARGSKSAIVESTVYNKQIYYMVYGSPLATFQANQTQYFNTMEQSFTFTG